MPVASPYAVISPLSLRRATRLPYCDRFSWPRGKQGPGRQARLNIKTLVHFLFTFAVESGPFSPDGANRDGGKEKESTAPDSNRLQEKFGGAGRNRTDA
jgi:hypothetical protein